MSQHLGPVGRPCIAAVSSSTTLHGCWRKIAIAQVDHRSVSANAWLQQPMDFSAPEARERFIRAMVNNLMAKAAPTLKTALV